MNEVLLELRFQLHSLVNEMIWCCWLLTKLHDPPYHNDFWAFVNMHSSAATASVENSEEPLICDMIILFTMHSNIIFRCIKPTTVIASVIDVHCNLSHENATMSSKKRKINQFTQNTCAALWVFPQTKTTSNSSTAFAILPRYFLTYEKVERLLSI